METAPTKNNLPPTVLNWSRRPGGLEALRAAAEMAPDLRALLPQGGRYTVPYLPLGAAAQLQACTAPEVLISGPAGTGKSRACLERLHRLALTYPGLKGLIVRKTRESLSDAALMTYEEKVLPAGCPIAFGPQRRMRQGYSYPNGSEIAVGGIDKATKIMSTERDLIYCFIGETRVESPSPVRKVYSREYSGPLVTIRTASGNELTGTPNHPILTDNGWVALGLLNVGDHVVNCLLGEGVGALPATAGRDQPDIQDGPPTFAEVARAFAASPGAGERTQRAVGGAMDFHGDGEEGQVDVIPASGLFDLRRMSPTEQMAREDHVGQAEFELLALVGTRAPFAFPFGALLHRGVSERREEGRERLAVLFPSKPLRLGLGAGRVAPVLKHRDECLDADAELCGDFGHPEHLAGHVTLDRIIGCSRIDGVPGASRHVYNLQTADGWYLANGIVSHNCQEATELEENDWEYLTTRLRNGVAPYQQLLADCNPDRPTHWLKARADAGRTVLLESRHEDNPLLFAGGDWTEAGRDYIARLDALTGARLQRLRYGRWAAAEGLVYEGWDRALHVLPPQRLPAGWPRYWAVDFGYTNAFAWQQWTMDPDGRLYLEREIYRTQTLVKDHAAKILALASGIQPRAIICDHDAEGRATLEDALGITTTPAFKGIAEGIQAVAERLKLAGDGRPRLFLLANARAERDAALVEAKRTTCTEEEWDGYVWAKGPDGKPAKEEPVKDNDHGLDALRYLVAHVDEVGMKRARFFW